tara:strand:+ start:989 stop:1447 length:459 start_codon:yes stop_codon:yes gene_type:complete
MVLLADNPGPGNAPVEFHTRRDDSNQSQKASDKENIPTFDEWVAKGKKLPEGMIFLGGSPWFNESTGQRRTAQEVYKLLYGKKVLKKPAKQKRPHAKPGKRKPFPKHWGDPPKRQTRDLRPLPGGYGMGSGTLAHWIQENLDRDQKKDSLPD